MMMMMTLQNKKIRSNPNPLSFGFNARGLKNGDTDSDDDEDDAIGVMVYNSSRTAQIRAAEAAAAMAEEASCDMWVLPALLLQVAAAAITISFSWKALPPAVRQFCIFAAIHR